MKSKTIEKVIYKKFNEFLESIKDENVKKLIAKNSIITGGCIASMLLNEKVNDYDIYFSNKETVKFVAEYYVKIFNDTNSTDGYVLDGAVQNERNIGEDGGAALNMTPDRIKIVFDSDGVAKENGIHTDEIHELGDTIEIKDDEGEKYRPVFLSGNAISLSSGVQLIIRFYGEAKEIHDNYDFAHCTNYWLSQDRKCYLNQKALECILAKELFYIGSKYPLASIIRIRKFIKRGWQINAGQILKMCFQLNLLDLTDIKVLEDQLVGVDLAYFFQLISALKGVDKEKLEYGYLATIIDRIF